MIGDVALADDGEVLQFAPIDLDGFGDQLPADAGNDLLAPGVKESGKTDATGGGGSAELGIALQQNRLGSHATRLNRCDVTGGSSADDEHIDVEDLRILRVWRG